MGGGEGRVRGRDRGRPVGEFGVVGNNLGELGEGRRGREDLSGIGTTSQIVLRKKEREFPLYRKRKTNNNTKNKQISI